MMGEEQNLDEDEDEDEESVDRRRGYFCTILLGSSIGVGNGSMINPLD